MRLPKTLVNQRVDAFLQACRDRAIRVTHQRIEIYREVASTDEHPDAAVIHQRLRKRMPTISLDTVYRNLRLLEEHGIITQVGMSDERMRFDGNLEPHHHFTCVRCGKKRDFTSNPQTRVAWPEEANALGRPILIHLEIRGVCKDCETA